MRAEYSAGQRPILLSEGSWYTEVRPTSNSTRQHLANGSQLAGPYIWHVKDHEPGECCSSKRSCWPVKRGVQRHWKTPYFLRDLEVNAQEARDSFELWFGLVGGGALSHADAYNEMTLSLQFRGTKTWRLAMHPAVATAFDSFRSHDGGIYAARRWFPEYEFSLQPGACFVFPPGYFHETLVKAEDNAESPCTVAATFQFNAPFPARYWRRFLPRWMNSHLGWAESGASFWGPLATISATPAEPTLNASLLEDRASALLLELDGDKDGFVSQPELLLHFSSASGSWARSKDFAWEEFLPASDRKRVKSAVEAELAQATADAVIAFQDLDGDDQITADELYTSLWQWDVLSWRKRQQQRIRDRAVKGKQSAAELKQFEVQFLRNFGACSQELAAGGACERLQQLATEPAAPISDIRNLPLFQTEEVEQDFARGEEL